MTRFDLFRKMLDGNVVWLGFVGSREEALEALKVLTERSGYQYFAFDSSTRAASSRAGLKAAY